MWLRSKPTAPCLARKYQARLEVAESEKRTSLLRGRDNYSGEGFIVHAMKSGFKYLFFKIFVTECISQVTVMYMQSHRFNS